MKKSFACLFAVLLGLGLTACAAGTGEDSDVVYRLDNVVFQSDMPAETAPVAQIIPETTPAPDYDLYIADQPIPTAVGCVVTDQITAHFINNTGKDAQVLLIPYLEKLDENGEWADVPFRDGVGFCGTPDPLPTEGKEWSWEISMLWGTLEAGQYRLRCKVGPDFHTDGMVSGEFTLFTPENNAGLPLAPRD